MDSSFRLIGRYPAKYRLTWAHMSESKDSLDVQLLQAKWVLGGVEPEQLVQAAVLALEQGFDGTALQQLAGLSHSAARDLGTLPAKAFAEMGLKPTSEDEAVSILLDRDEPRTSAVISNFRHAFPDFLRRWRECIAYEGGNSSGSYIDMGEVVHFVVEDVYEKGNLDETRRVFQFFEQQLLGADEETRNLIGLGFFETLQCFASWRQGGNRVYEQFLGPISIEILVDLQMMWAGKSSLADVIRAERKAKEPGKSD
jgi:hypothetical protein